MLVDTHCHLHMLDLSLFDNDMDNVIAQAKLNGVSQFLCVSTQLVDYDILHTLCQRYDAVLASVGVHPNEPFDTASESESQLLAKLAASQHIIAIGETGLDYFRTPDPALQILQQQRFIQHITIAKSLKKPLIIHTRNAAADTIRIMREQQADLAGGIMHCFCESWEIAQEALKLGFYISISGIVTFNNAHALQEVAQRVPLDRLLLETDCPYLAPMPFRGKPNQPAYVRYVAEKIAALRNLSYETVALQTTENFFTLFRR